jgi:hypothetical protein
MKFVMLVEGHTEQKAIPAFIKRWLDPRLARPVGIQTDRFKGWTELVKDLPAKVAAYLNGPRSNHIIAVVALLDLYGPSFYPLHLKSADERAAWAVEYLHGQVNNQRFRMFFAVHETEAWLLSKPDLFPDAVRKSLPGRINWPEKVNFDEPPGKLLTRLYMEKQRQKYRKVSQGKAFFDQLDPELVYTRCPHFAQMLDEMLQLARQAGL